MLTTALTNPPRDGKCGSNLQNIEGSMREIYVPDGYDISLESKYAEYQRTKNINIFTPEEAARTKILVNRDQSGAEALIVAYLTKHGLYRDLFLHGIKPHVYVALIVFTDIWQTELNKIHSGDLKPNAAEILSLPIVRLTSHPHWKTLDKLIRSSDSWSNDRRYYYISKQIVHASSYGMKAGMFQINTLEKSRGAVVISKKDAEKYLDIFHSTFPEIRQWHKEIERQLNDCRMLFNLQGFPRFFWSSTYKYPEALLKEAYAFIPQSTVACITRQAYIDLQKYIEETTKDWDLLNDNHDSFMSQVPLLDERDAATKMKEYIEPQLVGADGSIFNMRSECQTGFNWGKWDAVKNPYGLKEFV